MYLLITRHTMDLVTCSLLVWLLHFNLLSIFQVDVLESMKHFVHVSKLQKENQHILENLQVGIITEKSEEPKEGEVKHKDKKFFNRFCREIITGDGAQKKIDSNLKLFKKIQIEDGKEIQQIKREQACYSINNIIELEDYELGEQIFEVSYENDVATKKKYVQIKKQLFIVDNTSFKVIQILDVSANILLNQASGEKKLLSLINATVSHEMRTPINSIACQNLQIKYLIEKLQELLNDESATLTMFRQRLVVIISQMSQSNNITLRSTKLLTFVIQDILDYS